MVDTKVSFAQGMLRVAHSCFLLPVDQDEELSQLPLQHHVHLYYVFLPNMDYTSETESQHQLNAFLYNSCSGHGLFTAIENLSKQ